MPSIVLGNPFLSGAVSVISGNPWSGQLPPLKGGVQLFWTSSGGNCYIGFSGGGPPLSGGFMTINSGTMILSGGIASGMLDGMCLTPGMGYWIDRTQVPAVGNTMSGIFNIFAICDPQASGIGRLYFDVR